ncbi:MAG: tetratricopeptide repeat protein [Magnetovibrio sp.]|nr:tetratricopeptide repeat protein [Magnetovibrio sp.]
MNELERSLEMLELATQKPDAPSGILLDLAQMYVDRERIQDAEKTCLTYIDKYPDSPLGYSTLAQLYENQNDFLRTIEFFRKAVDVVSGDDGSEPAHLNTLGAALRRTGEPHEAVDVLQRAIDIDPQRPEPQFNIANAYMDCGNPDKAIDHYRLTLDITPQSPDTHLHLGFAYLINGTFKRGWREMEWRWKIPVFANTALDTPRWKGDTSDGTILLLAEQGLGDSVHFIRYAKQVAQRCSRVIAYVPPALVRLAASTHGVDEAIGWNSPIPAHDAYIPMMSLPGVFKTELNTIPAAVPYLQAEQDDVQKWANKLALLPGIKVGFVWQGSPQNARERGRAIPTDAALELVRSVDASFICLAKDRPQGIEDWPENLHHFGDEFDDVSSAAALVENLDLVLSIDTLMTHLAGALNKELWTLLAPVADWRYLLDREDSPWYPSAKLVRRQNDEDWHAFMAHIAEDLKARV